MEVLAGKCRFMFQDEAACRRSPPCYPSPAGTRGCRMVGLLLRGVLFPPLPAVPIECRAGSNELCIRPEPDHGHSAARFLQMHQPLPGPPSERSGILEAEYRPDGPRYFRDSAR